MLDFSKARQYSPPPIYRYTGEAHEYWSDTPGYARRLKEARLKYAPNAPPTKQQLESLEAEIFEIAGGPFQFHSDKQVSVIADEALRGNCEDLLTKIVEYRYLDSLKQE